MAALTAVRAATAPVLVATAAPVAPCTLRGQADPGHRERSAVAVGGDESAVALNKLTPLKSLLAVFVMYVARVWNSLS